MKLFAGRVENVLDALSLLFAFFAALSGLLFSALTLYAFFRSLS